MNGDRGIPETLAQKRLFFTGLPAMGASLGDASMLIMAKSGGGKTFMAQLFLLMMARANPQISVIERGDSYQPLAELMGGRVIDVKLDGTETLNP